jgi:hypothetical protein
MRMSRPSTKPAQSRAIAGLAFAMALLGTMGCNTVAAPVDPAPEINVVAGQEFNGVVDTFTDSDTTALPLGAQIDWGDITASGDPNVTLGDVTTRTDGTDTFYDVNGANTYTTPGDYTATVDFVDTNLNLGEGTVQVHVSETPELDSLILFGTALMGAGGSAFSRRWISLVRAGKLRRLAS